MPKDICIVTAMSRPEMLHECLSRIKEASGGLDIAVIVSIDGERLVNYGKPYPGHNKEVVDVALSFTGKIPNLLVNQRINHVYPGNSYNTLEALKEAYGTGAQYVFLVEEDVMVARDFFHWHYAAHALVPLFCSVATACTRRHNMKDISDPAKIWLSCSDYASLGVCFPHHSLSYIVPHAQHAYYHDMNGYCRRQFSNSRFASEFCEQDGLIIRAMGYWNGLSAWPYPKVARAFHAGYYGYHRMDGAKPTGTLEERIRFFKEVMFDPDTLAQLTPNTADITPCLLDGYEWQTLDLDEIFG